MSGRVLRLSEEQFRERAAKRSRWQVGADIAVIGEANAHDANPPVAGNREAQAAVPVRTPTGGTAPIPYERDVLKACIRLLALDSRVNCAHRMNSGAYVADGRFVRFGFKGCPDILGMMSDGRVLAIEVKRPGGRASDDQLAFLGRVRRAGGVAFVAWSVDDVRRGLGTELSA